MNITRQSAAPLPDQWKGWHILTVAEAGFSMLDVYGRHWHGLDVGVRYTLGEAKSKQIFASRYKLHLPTETELQAELLREVKKLNPAPAARPDAAKKANQTMSPDLHDTTGF